MTHTDSNRTTFKKGLSLPEYWEGKRKRDEAREELNRQHYRE
jgi:hypothetical protein